MKNNRNALKELEAARDPDGHFGPKKRTKAPTVPAVTASRVDMLVGDPAFVTEMWGLIKSNAVKGDYQAQKMIANWQLNRAKLEQIIPVPES